MMSIPKYILFDVENVLFPATELYLDSLKIVLAKSTNGKYILKTDALMASEFGTMSYSDVFDFLHTGTGFARFTSDQKAVLANRLFVQTEYLIQHSDLIKTRNESLELFRWLTDSGFKLAICTNLPQSILMNYLVAVGYEPFFEVIVAPDKFEKTESFILWPKPSIELYRKTMNMLSANEEDILTIEGTSSGIAAAKIAKIRFIATNSPNQINLVNIKEAFIKMGVITEQ